MIRSTAVILGIVSACLPAGGPSSAQPPGGPSREEALHALKRACAYYHSKVASHGGYVYYYGLDLKERWGEGKATPDILFVQPPGTPTVGMAFLKAHAATGEKFYLEAARDAAEALVYGQLESGGWTQVIHYAKANRMGKYRNGKGGGWNVSSLDDGQTQAALLMLIRADQALGFQHAEIHEAARYGLDALLKVQYANGAFPQGWRTPLEGKPATKARYPDFDWRTEGKYRNYHELYTLNDNLAGTVAETLFAAHTVYRDVRYQQALEKLGDFLIQAQMPEPQPGWCQQYNYEMMPVWARKFEPPAITGWEAQDVMETLLRIAEYTGKLRYLEPIPRALEYYKKSLLPDGRVARYYELHTNRPLYMDAKYQLTHDDRAIPNHYGWKQPARFDEIERAYQAVRAGKRPAVQPQVKTLEAEVRKILQELDAEGRWITTYAGERLVGQPKFADGFRFLSSAVFSRNVETLSRYLEATRR